MSKALDKFTKQQRLALQLVEIHEAGPGGVKNREALNRAGVVFCVAFWQAYVENVVKEAYEEIESKTLSSNVDEATLLKEFFVLNKNLLEHRIESFNTPNSENVTKLLKLTLKVNPNDIWEKDIVIMDSEKGAKNKPKKFKGGTIQTELNSWLNVRHSIAHGDDQIRDRKDGTKMKFPLNYDDLKGCIDFFSLLAEHTDSGIDSQLRSKFNITLK